MTFSSKTRNAVVKADAQGLFISLAGKLFRPDWSRERDTPMNRTARRELAEFGLPLTPPALPYSPVEPGAKVNVSREGPDNLLVWYAIDGSDKGRFLNWSNDGAPARIA
jgi:hypothetical protein